jgi:two-component system, OmpR family, alkaline phosphatase synthesis response regulator PhoP
MPAVPSRSTARALQNAPGLAIRGDRDLHALMLQCAHTPVTLTGRTGVPRRNRAMHDPPRILIVDDNATNRDILAVRLATQGYDLHHAADGEEALAAAQKLLPDLILLDVMMPKLSGFEVCKRIKSEPATRDIAVLMITALDQPSDVERAVDVGTNDFLTKPINKAELLLRVHAMLAARSGQGELAETLDYINAVQDGK